MISYSDPDYLHTKSVLCGQNTLCDFHKNLIHWIKNQYSIPVINIYEDRIIPDNRKRVQIIFKYLDEALQFRKQQGFKASNIDKIKQNHIEKAYWELLTSYKSQPFEREKIFICFGDFETVARREAFSKIPNTMLQQISERSSIEIWRVEKTFNFPIFFVEKNADLQKITDAEKNDITNKLKAAMRPFDEFDFFKEKPLVPSFDSKQNFDEVYNGSWFNYFR